MTKWGIYLICIGMACLVLSFFIDRVGMAESSRREPEEQ